MSSCDKSPHFCPFALQILLVQFLIINALSIFKEDTTHLSGQCPVSCYHSKKAAGATSGGTGRGGKQTDRLPGPWGDAETCCSGALSTSQGEWLPIALSCEG